MWDGWNISLDLDGSNAVKGKYVRGLNLIVNMPDNLSASWRFYMYNAHGDVVQLVNTMGFATMNYQYDAFGNEMGSVSNDANPFRYCGEYFDKETGTLYLRARHYDASIGRFTQQDGWWYANPGDPLSLNLYTYCHNNPIMYADPSGHFIWFVVIGIAVGAAIGGGIAAHQGMQAGHSGWQLVGDIATGALIGGVAGGIAGLGVGLAAAGIGAIAAGGGLIQGGMIFTAGALPAIGAGIGMAGGATYGLLTSDLTDIRSIGRVMDCTSIAAVTMYGLGQMGEMAAYGWNRAYTAFSTRPLYRADVVGTTRATNRYHANKQFYNEMASNPSFKARMDKRFGYDVMAHMQTGKGALRNPSTGWVWHHPANNPSQLHLINRSVHTNPFFQWWLHPYENGGGGFAKWFK